MSEVITSVEMNFVNNGGGHTASVSSVLNSVSTSKVSELGSLNGSLGDRYDFSNEKISKLMKQFIAVEETTSEDSNNAIKKSVKFKDRVSLIMDSHVFVVRGESTSPFDSDLPFEGAIFKHSEHPFSSVAAAPSLGPKKEGGVITIGKTYSVASGNFRGEPYSLGYHNKELEDGLVYNLETAARDSESTNLSNYSLLYGYKISELKEALGLLGLKTKNLPDSEAIFSSTGKISSVISSIASTLGYYWYVNPFNGEITFINSIEAIQKIIANPLNFNQAQKQKIQNASFTESKLKKAIVNSFVGDFEDFKGDGGDDNDRERKTNFYLIPFDKILNEDFFQFTEYFYGLWASKNWNDFKFNALYLYILFNYEDFRKNIDVLLPDYIAAGSAQPANPKKLTWPKGLNITVNSDEEKKAKNSNKPFGRRDDAFFYDMASKAEETSEDSQGDQVVKKLGIIDPSKLKLMELIGAYFETLHKGFFVSPTYSFKQAERRKFNSGDLQVKGPFKKKAKLVDIEDLSFMRPFLERFDGGEDITIEQLLIKSDLQREGTEGTDGSGEDQGLTSGDESFTSGFTKDYIFIGLKDKPVINIKFNEANNQLLKFDFLNEKTVEMFFEPAGREDSYIGYKEDVTYIDATGGSVEVKMTKALSNALLLSKSLYNSKSPVTDIVEEEEEGVTAGGDLSEPTEIVPRPDDVIRVAYEIKSRAEIDAEASGEELETEDTPTNTDSGEDVSNDFEQKYFNIINNGADGDPLHPADLISKKGFIGEIKAAEANAYKVAEIPRQTLKSSSRTIYGLEIPTAEEYDITLTSLSLSLAGGQGVTTTIGESTIDLIPVDEQFVISDFYNKATSMRSTSPRMTANQRNFLGL